MKLSLKNSAVDTLLAIQAMEGMGWEFDPNESREDQIIGLVFSKIHLLSSFIRSSF